jgi:FdhE protein
LSSALADLDRLAVDRPELANPARTLGRLLAAAFSGDDPAGPTDAELAAMVDGWAQGRPAFRSHAPNLDNSALEVRVGKLLDVLKSESEAARTLRGRRIDLEGWASEIVAGRPEEVTCRAEGSGVDPALALSILGLALLPALSRYSAGLDRFRPESAWDRGDCPCCGSRPLLAESRGLEQRIYYRCGLCASAWAGDRLRCPSCGEDDPRARHHSSIEGEGEKYRLSHCETCRYDWKVVSTLTALSPPAIIVADLATHHLGVLAEGRRGPSTRTVEEATDG